MPTRSVPLARLPCLLALAVAACAGKGEPAPPRALVRGSLAVGDVAVVGSDHVEASLVSAVAAARHVAPRDALDRVVADALAAEGARARGFDRLGPVVAAVRVVRARFVADAVRDASRSSGPPTDAEIDELTRLHWFELDSPEQLRVVHAVAMCPAHAAPDADARALAVAEEIARRVATAPSVDDFERAARSVRHDGVDVRIERLAPFVPDGRVADASGATMDLDFTRAAFELASAEPPPPTPRGPVRSAFGWHVIRVVERVPARRLSLDDRRALLGDEALTRRTRAALDGLLTALRSTHAVDVAPDADTLMAGIPVAIP